MIEKKICCGMIIPVERQCWLYPLIMHDMEVKNNHNKVTLTAKDMSKVDMNPEYTKLTTMDHFYI